MNRYVSRFVKIMKEVKAKNKGKGKKDGSMGFEFKKENMDGMMAMLGGFTLLRMSGMMGMLGVNLTKEDLLSVNKKLNRIKKPKEKVKK